MIDLLALLTALIAALSMSWKADRLERLRLADVRRSPRC